MTIRYMEPPAARLDTEPLTARRLAAAKRGFCTRRFDPATAVALGRGETYRPRAGDLVLARVQRIGQHKRIELPNGRRAHLFAGDEIVLAYGQRYAPDQFESRLPDDLGPCDMVAAGGMASRVLSRHARMSPATRVEPIGVLLDSAGHVINLQRFAIPGGDDRLPSRRPPVIAVLGTSMNAGKTTAAARLILGLSRAGRRVAACKVTGTGAGGDFWMMQDAGAVQVRDFTDAGHVSTFGLSPAEIRRVLRDLVRDAVEAGPDAIVLEVADGLFQHETRALTEDALFRELVDGVVFAANDAMGAVSGAEILRARGLPLLAVTGAFTAAPLAVREATCALDEPVLKKNELSDPEIATGLLSLAVGDAAPHEVSGTA